MITDEQHSTHLLSDTTRPITAQEAWERIAVRVYALDPQARLVALTSGEDIDSNGRSRTWQFEFVLPVQIGRAGYEFAPSTYEDDQAPLVMHEHVKPFGTPQRRATESPEVMREGWHVILAKSRPLPVPFRNSSVAVEDIAAQGVNFSSGDMHMTLTGKVLPDSRAVWFLVSYGTTYTTPFQANVQDTPQ